MFNLFRLCRQDEISFDVVAKNSNNVEATFDFVEKIVPFVAFDNVVSTLLLVWTGLVCSAFALFRRMSVKFHLSPLKFHIRTFSPIFYLLNRLPT